MYPIDGESDGQRVFVLHAQLSDKLRIEAFGLFYIFKFCLIFHDTERSSKIVDSTGFWIKVIHETRKCNLVKTSIIHRTPQPLNSYYTFCTSAAQPRWSCTFRHARHCKRSIPTVLSIDTSPLLSYLSLVTVKREPNCGFSQYVSAIHEYSLWQLCFFLLQSEIN